MSSGTTSPAILGVLSLSSCWDGEKKITTNQGSGDLPPSTALPRILPGLGHVTTVSPRLSPPIC